MVSPKKIVKSVLPIIAGTGIFFAYNYDSTPEPIKDYKKELDKIASKVNIEDNGILSIDNWQKCFEYSYNLLSLEHTIEKCPLTGLLENYKMNTEDGRQIEYFTDSDMTIINLHRLINEIRNKYPEYSFDLFKYFVKKATNDAYDIHFMQTTLSEQNPPDNMNTKPRKKISSINP